MIQDKLKNHTLILASGSPRRQQFFKDLGLDFEIRLKPVDEVYPEQLVHFEISDYLAQLKSLPFKEELKDNDILVTSDTIVWHNEKALGKPEDYDDAFNMLSSMSNATHEVITSISFTTKTTQKTENAITIVTFKALNEDEIDYYVKTFKPYDKAGAYGIQEWIGQIGITNIEGSYTNVVGLPTHLLYKTLNSMVL
jgi:septum formation protein